LLRLGLAHHSASWACYHTSLYETERDGLSLGVVGCAVGSPFAVLVAEEMFAAGCQLLISMTSAGQVADDLPLPSFIVIERALRGEGTSHRYLPPDTCVAADTQTTDAAVAGIAQAGLTALRGMTWTTDAPFRETASSLTTARAAGALAVEMEAAALYAFAQARKQPVICFAHVTNQMAQVEGDFEKGPDDGAEQALDMVCAAAKGWLRTQEEERS
jgi:uridine phosphorylase